MTEENNTTTTVKVAPLLEKAIDALKPMSDAVFNDNGDMSVSLPLPSYDECVKAYFVAKQIRNALETPPAPQITDLKPIKPLLATRFKLSFDSKGRCTTFRKDQAEQLFGEWVWLIEAANGMNDPLYTVPPPPAPQVMGDE